MRAQESHKAERRQVKGTTQKKPDFRRRVGVRPGAVRLSCRDLLRRERKSGDHALRRQMPPRTKTDARVCRYEGLSTVEPSTVLSSLDDTPESPQA